MHRRILTLALAGVMLVTLASCGQKTPAPASEAQTTETRTTAAREAEGDVAGPQAQTAENDDEDYARDWVPSQEQTQQAKAEETKQANTQTGPLFQKYVRGKVADGTYTLRTEQSGMKIVIAMDGSDSAIESDAAGLLHFTLIHKGDEYYMVMHTSKKYTKMSAAEYEKQVDTLGSSAVELDNLKLRSTGSETVDGKHYSTETYDEGDLGVVTYFFDDTGVRRTRMVKDGKTTQTDVFVVSGDVDASAFEIPSGYTLVSDPTQLLT